MLELQQLSLAGEPVLDMAAFSEDHQQLALLTANKLHLYGWS